MKPDSSQKIRAYPVGLDLAPSSDHAFLRESPSRLKNEINGPFGVLPVPDSTELVNFLRIGPGRGSNPDGRKMDSKSVRDVLPRLKRSRTRAFVASVTG